jgi:hypothetical protein
MGMWSRLASALGLGRRERESKIDALARMGVYIVADEKLEERVKQLQEFFEVKEGIVALKRMAPEMRPEDVLRRLIEDMNGLNRQIDRLATPWWRALDDRNASTVMRAWGTINGYFHDIALTLLNWFEKTDNGIGGPRLPKEVLVASFLSMVIREYLPRAETLIRVSWSETDIAPSWTGAIQLPPTMAGYGPPPRQIDTGSPSRQVEEEYEARDRAGRGGGG